ncbi:uncharacterized protein LOC119180271 isoform X3 [Rhipicephalus microplus]|uniref:uncharacterized protein LOC119180271 isoform X3 n=1 Tax=Rhipicephalus microplus TaxID=6941 RepID=UPI003F6CCC01
MRSAVLRVIFVVLMTMTEHATSIKKDMCVGKSGVITNSKSAATASKLLAKCGHRLALKFNVSAKVTFTTLRKSCVIAHLCYAQVDGAVKETIQSNLLKCGRAYVVFLASCFPEVLGMPVEEVDRMFTLIENCIRAEVPVDKHITLGMLRYVRGLYFTG